MKSYEILETRKLNKVNTRSHFYNPLVSKVVMSNYLSVLYARRIVECAGDGFLEEKFSFQEEEQKMDG